MNKIFNSRSTLMILVLSMVIGCTSNKLLTRDTFTKFDTLTILSIPKIDTIQFFDRTGTHERTYAGQSHGAIGSAIGHIIVSAIADHKIKKNVGGEIGDLRRVLNDYNFKTVIDEEIQSINSAHFKVMSSSGLSTELVDLLRQASKPKSDKQRVYQSINELSKIKTLAIVEFEHGLFVRGGVTDPVVGIKANLIVIDLESQKKVLKKNISSELGVSAYKAATIDELILNDGKIYKDGFKNAAKFIAHRVAFDIGGYKTD